MRLLTLALTLTATVSSAQTHPCDVPVPTVYREPSSQVRSLRVGFCFIPVDTEGLPLTELVGFALQVNGGADVDLGVLVPLGGPNVQGASYYEVQTTALAAGVVTVKAYTKTLGMSAPSTPVTLTLLGPPRAPFNSTVIRD